jgi:tRNA pseudouridine38-40 synthase
MRNIKLIVAYDGTDFHGWQLQQGSPTIQGALIDVASKLTQEKIFLFGAGRTDAGVHALGQVAHFKTQSGLSPAEFQRAFNALLPPAIRVVDCEEESPNFHARFQAQAKTYQYRIFRGRIVPPFDERYVLHYPYPLDEDAMARAARLFEGKHDFTSFAASSGSEDDDRQRAPEREIFQSEIRRVSRETIWSQSPLWSAAQAVAGSAAAAGSVPAPGSRPVLDEAAAPPGDELLYTVRGRSFLRYMVRKMVGTLLDVGRGRLTVDDIPRLFDLRDRSKSGPTAPPHGLFLVSVEYPEPWKMK